MWKFSSFLCVGSSSFLTTKNQKFKVEKTAEWRLLRKERWKKLEKTFWKHEIRGSIVLYIFILIKYVWAKQPDRVQEEPFTDPTFYFWSVWWIFPRLPPIFRQKQLLDTHDFRNHHADDFKVEEGKLSLKNAHKVGLLLLSSKKK